MPLSSTYTPIATYTVSGSSVANINFTSIAATYTDIVAVCSLRSTNASATTDLGYRCNGSSSNVYDGIRVKGDGTSATSDVYKVGGAPYYGLIGTMAAASATSGTFSNHIVQWINYSNTTTYKTCLTRSNNAATTAEAVVSMFFNTSAINQLTFYPTAGNFDIGSTITLYGIKAA